LRGAIEARFRVEEDLRVRDAARRVKGNRQRVGECLCLVQDRLDEGVVRDEMAIRIREEIVGFNC
jgi:hypothetical protein